MKKNLLISIATISVGILVFMVFLPALGNDFINWDDDINVYENSHIKNLNGAFFRWAFLGFSGHNSEYWMPMSYLSHAVVYSVSGDDPRGHHLANNIIHALNSVLVVVLVLMLVSAARADASEGDKFSLIAAVTTGLLFGLHPLRVESVVWISERKDLLSAFFYLLAMISYVKYAAKAKVVSAVSPRFLINRKYIFAAVFFVLALMSKPMAVTLPLALLLIDWYPMKRVGTVRDLRDAVIEKLPFIVLAGAFSHLIMLTQKDVSVVRSVEHVPFLMRLVAAFRTTMDYVLKMIMPVNLSVWYDYPADISLFSFKYGLPVLIVIAVTAISIYMAGKNRLWLSVLGYYLTTLLPVLGIFVAIPLSMADRYTYLPGLAPMLLVGLSVAAVSSRITGATGQRKCLRAGLSVLGISVLLCLSYATIRQIGFWKNSIIFWSHFIEKTAGQKPNYIDYLSMAHNNLGNAYAAAGRIDDAIKEYLKALKHGRNYADVNSVIYADLHNNLGSAYTARGQYQEALNEYKAALTIRPASRAAQVNLSNIYLKLGRFDDAIHISKLLLQVNAFDADAHSHLGQAYSMQGRIDEAIDEYRKVIESDPDNSNAYINLGVIYMGKGDIEMARREFESLLKVDPNNYWAQQMIAYIYGQN